MSSKTAGLQTVSKPSPAQPTSAPSPHRNSLRAERTPTLAPPIVHDVLRSGGRPLDASSRAFFEPRFGHDFSRVRIHDNPAASSSARAVNAAAYTVGPNVVFNSGRFAPQSPAGRSLLAHELTHVVQQRSTRVDTRNPIPIGSPGTAHELEADRSARHLSPARISPLSSSVAQLLRSPASSTLGSWTPDTPSLSQLNLAPAPRVSPLPRRRRTAAPAPTTDTKAPPPHLEPIPKAPPPAPAQAQAPATPPATTPPHSDKQPAPTSAPVASAPAALAAPSSAPASGKAAAPGKPGDSARPVDKPEATKTAGASEAPSEESEGPTKAPISPRSDPGFQAVAGRIKSASGKLKTHAPASAKAQEAQAAAASPPAELRGRASAAQAAAIDKEKPKAFDRAAFIKALMEKIASIAPKTLKDADDFKESGKVASLKGDLSKQAESSKAAAQGDIPARVQQAPDPNSVAPKTVTPLAPVDAGPQPPDVDAAAAMPGPRPDSETSLAKGSASLDNQMAKASVTEEQLKKSNEPEFQGALDAKKTAQADAIKAPEGFRKDEKATLGHAQTDSHSTAQKNLQTMHGGRTNVLGKVAGHQTDTKTNDEQTRAEIAKQIQDRYETTKTRTEARLNQLDKDSDAAFDKGASEAQKAFDNEVDTRMTRYKDERYDQLGGSLLWAKDKLLGMPDEVNDFYVQARDNYIRRMKELLNSIATIVETGLNEAKAIVAEGRKSIDDYLNGLPTALQALGHEAAQGIQSKFDELEQTINDKQGDLIDSLAKKYTENLQQIDDKIADMKKANGGLVDAAISAVKGVIDTIINIKNMLLNVLAKASEAIDLIIADPIGFLGNLVAAVKKGFMGFVGKIGMYLEQGLMGWLFGALADAGIEMPKTFDLKGILGLVLQVLGLTYANIRSRAVKILGEKVVSTLETAAEIFKTLITEGPAGLWRWIKEKFETLKESVIGSIKEFVMTRIITAGVTWIISLLNPASAFIKACKAIYDIVMFFVERGAQIMALINAILDSIINIAKGNIAGAAAYVESVLAKTVPILISFLASLLGLGGISEKIKAILEKIRAPINALIDWVINLAVTTVKAMGKLLGFGKKEDPADAGMGPSFDKTKNAPMESETHTLTAKVEAGNVTILLASKPEELAASIVNTKQKLTPQIAGGQKRLNAINEDLDDIASKSTNEYILKTYPNLVRRRPGQPDIPLKTSEAAIEGHLDLLARRLFALAEKYKIKELQELASSTVPEKRFLPADFKPRSLYDSVGGGRRAMDQAEKDQKTEIVGLVRPLIAAKDTAGWDRLADAGKLPKSLKMSLFDDRPEKFTEGHVRRGNAANEYQVHHQPALYKHWSHDGGNNADDDKRSHAAQGTGEGRTLMFITGESHAKLHEKDDDASYHAWVGRNFTSSIADGGIQGATSIDNKPMKLDENK